MGSPLDRLRAAYAETAGNLSRSERRLAESFEPDADLERMAERVAADPGGFSASARLQTGFYAHRRDLAARLAAEVAS